MAKPESTKSIGTKGEQLAADFLSAKGYRIVQRNYFAFKVEIDLIALDESTNQIVFIEVKTLRNDFFQQPYEEVNLKKQRNIIKAADTYLRRHDIDKEARFDVVSIVLKPDSEPEITHIISAFCVIDLL
mgnify:FL=1